MHDITLVYLMLHVGHALAFNFGLYYPCIISAYENPSVPWVNGPNDKRKRTNLPLVLNKHATQMEVMAIVLSSKHPVHLCG